MGNSHRANVATATRVRQAQQAQQATSHATPPRSYLRLSPQVASQVRHAYRQAQRAQVYLDAVHAAHQAPHQAPHENQTPLSELGELLLLPAPTARQRTQLETLTRDALAAREAETPRGRDSTARMALALRMSGSVGATEDEPFPRSFVRDAQRLRYTSATLTRRLQTADRARARALAALPG